MSVLAISFPFVHPALAAAALAAGLIPLVIHLLNRRRYRRVPWAAMSFLRAAVQKSTTKLFLERWLLVALRIVAVIALGLALARPYLPATSLTSVVASRSHRILVIDNSLSTRAIEADGRTRVDKALSFADALVSSFPDTDSVSLVTMASPAEAPINYPAHDRRLVRERLGMTRSTQRSTDATGALKLALDLVRASPAAAANRFVYVISDFPAAVWETDGKSPPSAAMLSLRRLADALPRAASSLVLVPTAFERRPNVALSRVESESSLMAAGMPLRVVAEVTNHGPSTVRGLRIQMRGDPQWGAASPARSVELPPLEPGAVTTARLTTEFDSAGTHAIELKLVGGGLTRETAGAADALSDDDARYVCVALRTGVSVLLVDGRPGATPLAGQAGFLAKALSPRAPGEDTLIQPKVVTEIEIEAESLREHDVIVLCNVAYLPAERWRQLDEFVRAGGGLVIFGGDQVNPDHYNRFAYADGKGLLPGRFRRAVNHEGAPLTMRIPPPANRIVADLAEEPTSGFFSARVEQYLPFELGGPSARPVIVFDNGDAAMVAAEHGKGRVVVVTTSPNMEWTNLPAKGDFVSLMVNTVAYAARVPGKSRNLAVGESYHEPLTAAESSLSPRVTLHTGALSQEARLAPSQDSIALQFGPVEQPGVYSMSIGEHERHFVANVDAEESRIQPATSAKFLAGLDRPAAWVSDVAALTAMPARVNVSELASNVAYVVLGLLLLEMFLAMRFGTSRGGSRAATSVPR